MIYTKGEGHFVFNGLPANLYHVVINEKHYRGIEESVPIHPISSSPRFLTIYLVPRDARQAEVFLRSRVATHISPAQRNTQHIPNPARREYEKGVQSDQNGKPDEAIRHYQKSTELAPDFYEARNNL